MSAAKPFTLALLLQQRGAEIVVEGIGVEPTGLPFNSLAGIDKSAGEPLNPMVNAGAITAVLMAAGYDAAQVQALWDLAVEQFGGVDIWINNAGLARTVWPILDIPQEEIEAMVRTNMLGTINGSRVAAAGMQAQRGGKLFNILGGGSDGEYFPGLGIYGTTKRGLDYFTRALVKELDGSGVIVCRVRPGMIITEAVVREAREDLENFEKSRRMMNRLVDTVETVAPFLAEQMLAADKSGARIRWLTPAKMTGRMIKYLLKERPDQFEAFGL